MKNKVIYHSRKKFYFGKDIYWYEFVWKPYMIDLSYLIPQKFLHIQDTIYYEYGGTHEEALKDLTDNGFSDIIDGGEI